MSKVFISHNNIVSSLGFDSKDVVSKIHNKITGLKLIENNKLFPKPFYSSLIKNEDLESSFLALNPIEKYTRLEQMMILSLSKTIENSNIKLTDRVGLIISTTKGNIDALESTNPFPDSRAYLSELGKAIVSFFNFKNEAIVVSNACVSGVLAIAIAKRYILEKKYDHVFIIGGDIVTPFILSGFNSFQAISDLPCKPYDKNRTGINIGEVAASLLVTNSTKNLANDSLIVLGEGSCNDANHISGPSRTGEGLYRSIMSAFHQAKIEAKDVDYISAHGTATPFNDEMEAIAFNRSGLQNIPLNSLKGYFGHTLGASGLLETIIGMHSLYNNTLYASLGYKESGVTQPINVIKDTTSKQLKIFIKTASGFGGCNTAIIFKKINK